LKRNKNFETGTNGTNRNFLGKLSENSENFEFMKNEKVFSMKCEILGLINTGETDDDDSQVSLFQVK